MKKTNFILAFFVCFQLFIQAQTKVIIPDDGDDYSNYVKELENGKTDIDYKAFRASYLKSKQYKKANKSADKITDLKNEIYEYKQKSNFEKVIEASKKIISIDYTNMSGHMYLQKSYKALGDTINYKKYHDIEFGLLNSIVKNGDGKTCATSWPVIQISEEYFILNMLGAKLKKQSVDNEGGLCDKMVVEIDGEEKTYYFEVSKVFESYNIK